jgi:dihydroflavonol-4-reductase
MKALVTGGTGFIGSHLIHRLKNMGFEIRCISKDALNVSFLESMNVEVCFCDLNNGLHRDSILDGVDYVFHLAGVTHARKNRDYYEGNYSATKKITEACSSFSGTIKRFVYVSSLAAVGPSRNGKPVTEDTECHPVSEYGKSKLLAEREVMKHRDILPVTILRPSAVYGPRDRDMYTYIKAILRGIQPVIGFGRKYLNLIYVDDLVTGIIGAATNARAVDQMYMLGSTHAYQVDEIGNAIALSAGKNPVHICIPHFLVYMVGAWGELTAKLSGKSVFFNIQKAREAVQKFWTCSTDKAADHFGFSPKVSLVEGFQRTYSWYVNNNWL